MAEVLSVHELGDLKNWALAAGDDDPEDDFPKLVLKLLEENAELRTLLHGAKESGKLAVTEKLVGEVDRLRVEREGWLDKERQYKDRCLELEDRINLHALVLEKFIKTMSMARERLISGKGTHPEALSKLLGIAERQYAEDKERRF